MADPSLLLTLKNSTPCEKNLTMSDIFAHGGDIYCSDVLESFFYICTQKHAEYIIITPCRHMYLFDLTHCWHVESTNHRHLKSLSSSSLRRQAQASASNSLEVNRQWVRFFVTSDGISRAKAWATSERQVKAKQRKLSAKSPSASLTNVR